MPLSKAEFSIKAMCWVLRVARSGRYARCSRYHRISQRQQFRLACDAAVLKVFIDAKQKYGVPRLTDELPEYNIKTIDASLRRQGLRAKDARKFRPVSYREHGLPVCENLPKQNFYASAPNQKWVTDVTELKIAGKKLYLSPDLDLYNGEIVAYQMAHYQKRLKEAGLK